MPFDGPDGYVAGLEALARIVAPKRPLSVSAWSGQYRILSGKGAAEPGRWRNERIPYLTGPMDALDARHLAPLVVFIASSQVGKTEVGINWIFRTAHQCPGLILALFPTDRVSRKWVRSKLDPAIAATPVIRQLIPLGRKANAGNTLHEKHFPGGGLMTGSANIADDMRMTSAPYLLLEEVDSMPVELEDEGDPVELALRRLTNFPRSKAFMNSTPTTSDTSRIWPAWLSSTMDRYFMPCAHCNHMQFLRWQQLTWIPGKPGGAAYMCEECAALIHERSKTEMLAAGEWRATHPEREAEIKGFHANGLMTPIGLGDSWAKHAAAWERAQGSIARIQVFFNTRLGEVHKGERIKVEWERVHSRREAYKLRTIPKGVLTLTSGSDVQSDRIETQILGHGRGEQITVVDYIVHRGDVTRPEVWSLLDDYLAGEIVNELGVRMRLSCSLIDAGYLPDTVLGFTRPRKARGIFASRGSTVATRQAIGKPSYPDVKRRGKTDNRHFGAERYEIGVSVLKHWLYEQLRADEGTDELPVHIADRHIRFSADLGEEYFRQLTAETFDPKHGWIDKANYHRNEALDTFVLARAAAMHHSVNWHRQREGDFVRLEELFERVVEAKPVVESSKATSPFSGGFANVTEADTNY